VQGEARREARSSKNTRRERPLSEFERIVEDEGALLLWDQRVGTKESIYLVRSGFVRGIVGCVVGIVGWVGVVISDIWFNKQ
jgi:hypothetical protein